MIYLDNAATSYPKPESVYENVNILLRQYCGNPGRSGHKMALHSGRIILEAREQLSALFNVKEIERLIFTLNATDSFNIALKGFLKKGDHVITTTMEHNSLARPLKGLESKGVETTYVNCNEKGELDIKDIENAVKDNTVLIAATHASNVTGTIMPVKELGVVAKKKNIKFMIDASQTAGVIDIDVDALNVDFLIFTGHKGLYGIQGVGGLYISNKIDIEAYREGGTGSKSESLVQPNIYPDKFESGTPNTPGIAGLLAGVEFINKIGISKIRAYEKELTSYFLKELNKIEGIKIYGPNSPEKQVSVISINMGEIGSSEISYILDSSYDIATRPGLHCSPLAHKTIGTLEQGTVRFSIGYFNKLNELEKTINALKNIVHEV